MDDSTSLSRQQVVDLIDKRVAEAKAQMSDDRYNYALRLGGILLGIFGIALPIISSIRSAVDTNATLAELRNETQSAVNRFDALANATRGELHQFVGDQSRNGELSSAKIDVAIKDMRKQFQDLAGMQNRRPEIECAYEGRTLEGTTIALPREENSMVGVTLRNAGDGPAQNLRTMLYLDLNENDVDMSTYETRWIQKPSERHGFSRAWVAEQSISSLAPGEPLTLYFGFNPWQKLGTSSRDAILVVFCDQLSPRQFSFKFALQPEKK